MRKIGSVLYEKLEVWVMCADNEFCLYWEVDRAGLVMGDEWWCFIVVLDGEVVVVWYRWFEVFYAG